MSNYESNIAKFKNDLTKAEERALHAVGIFVRGRAQDLAPYDTARLKGSINYKIDNKEKAMHIGTNVEYAAYQEFGTGIYAENGKGRKGGWIFKDAKGKTVFTMGNKPQPFLRPAVLNEQSKIAQIIAEMGKEL
jgi:HK97 gp10 family phage protein